MNVESPWWDHLIYVVAIGLFPLTAAELGVRCKPRPTAGFPVILHDQNRAGDGQGDMTALMKTSRSLLEYDHVKDD
jgi:hypothetical protein